MPPIIFSRTNVEISLIALLSREIMIEQMIQWRVRHQAAGVFRYGDKTLFRSRILFFPRRERNSKFSFSACKISLKNYAWFANCTILHLISDFEKSFSMPMRNFLSQKTNLAFFLKENFLFKFISLLIHLKLLKILILFK